ncbi:MAG TPA: hypothetical protein VFP94_03220 [Terriglobales bacterium]|nr:hypothetical protein [Terriglobales bacterium]
MSAAQSQAERPSIVDTLRIERRSYVIGTLVVWAVIVVAMVMVFASMEPQLFAAPHAQTLQEAMRRAEQIAPLSQQQMLLLEGINLLGAVALFFLNWRFSFVLQRPRWAFVSSTPGVRFPARRWLWWAILSLVSLFYFRFLVPQLILTAVMAHWGTEEIRRRLHPPPPAAENS